MAPLTRNQQAALQSHPHPQTSSSLSAEWNSFANGASMTDELYQGNTASAPHHAAPFYSIQEATQPEQDVQQAAFIDSFGGVHHWKQQGDNHRTGQGRGSIDLTSPFTTPASNFQTLDDHTRSYSSEGIALAQKRLEAVQTSGTLSMDLQRLGTSSLAMHLPPSPTDATLSAQEGMRTFHQHTQSMGQVGRDMNDGMLRLDHGGADIDGTLMDQFGAKRRILSQSSSSIRSPSLSDRSVSSTAMFSNMSPHTSTSTMRHGDSSVDTSIDSISNSVTSMSADPSRCSSTSDDFMSIDTSASSSRRSIKGKTRLRNIDRKLICEAARDDPKIRQEDLASRFGIERSTVSKTLKNKDKWLVIQEESEGAMIIKHRSGKFPELEATLAQWARSQVAKGHAVLDVALRHRALEIAKQAGLGVDVFKASVGWIEKFRDRHDLSKSTFASSLLSGQRRAANANQRGSLSSGSATEVPVAQVGDVDMNSLFTPRDSTLRSQTSSSSMSNEESCPPATQETPKAAKRHYDDMNTNLPISSSIDSGMASLQFLQRTGHEGLLSLDQEMTSPSFGNSKRRKAGKDPASLSSRQLQMTSRGVEQASYSAQEKTVPSVLSRPQQQSTGYLNYTSESSSSGSNSRSRREVTSPIHQSQQIEESMPTAPFPLPGFQEDRRVTLQEARESLDLVLAFIARQPANLSPSDYFVLGNLQGTLSALAGQGQGQSQQQQQPLLQSPIQPSLVDVSSHDVYHDEQQHPRRSR